MQEFLSANVYQIFVVIGIVAVGASFLYQLTNTWSNVPIPTTPPLPGVAQSGKPLGMAISLGILVLGGIAVYVTLTDISSYRSIRGLFGSQPNVTVQEAPRTAEVTKTAGACVWTLPPEANPLFVQILVTSETDPKPFPLFPKEKEIKEGKITADRLKDAKSVLVSYVNEQGPSQDLAATIK